jgi:hypothetical protein
MGRIGNVPKTILKHVEENVDSGRAPTEQIEGLRQIVPLGDAELAVRPDADEPAHQFRVGDLPHAFGTPAKPDYSGIRNSIVHGSARLLAMASSFLAHTRICRGENFKHGGRKNTTSSEGFMPPSCSLCLRG